MLSVMHFEKVLLQPDHSEERKNGTIQQQFYIFATALAAFRSVSMIYCQSLIQK
ncbi:hypothetical protein HMPREF1613_04994 [Escherichia coli 908616]|nr:hypothetical protein HMPREF9552_05131 [Escherichia coli MS 198-1]EGB71479.1 hypothetical protein ERFG_02825 [Escherichia coli TW10509]ESA61279.1 hypothetical protein HMPREF1588_05363 [Escherichia coli 110957]ESA82331.1 hypothetical protein HMPREF1599_04446 [Escherichia coli 907713]ESD21880.1 hypothetical protein HMPREF1600_04105 [Escherichia coli 907715]ESD34032.1 hypothetical protein HMPREF1602_04343 [Escherichia coli 907889]ESD52622.1 hypothetical protein HMPREF1606_03639 [Escherichia co